MTTLVLPAKNEAQRLFLNLRELEAFLRKFPLTIEVLVVLDPSTDATEEEFKKFEQHLNFSGNTQIAVRLLRNQKALGRSRSVARGLREAKGEVVLVNSVGWSIPLTEIFQAMQEILHTPKVDVVIGNRHTSRKKRIAERSSWYWTLENLIKEKLEKQNLRVQDPLSPFLGFKKEALQKILSQWPPQGWFYAPGIVQAARELELGIKEIPILSQDRQASQIPLLKEYLRNLF
jgi:glycosyltransferase involved in cell wall biosynthesis